MDKVSAPAKLQRATTMQSLSASTTASTCSSRMSSPMSSSCEAGLDLLRPTSLRRCKTMPPSALQLEADYPEELVVRNTFLEFPIVRSDSLDDFVQERPCYSAPGCRSGAMPKSAADYEAPTSGPAVLQLANLLDAEPDVMLGSQNCPTEGSRGHWRGDCRPCAFFWKRAGCTTGVSCEFCHLCDSGEKKRRQKEKQRMLKEAAKAEKAATAGVGFRHALALSLGKQLAY